MAASISVSALNQHGAATISVSGDSSNTVRVMQITEPDGSVRSIPFTTNGSGAATLSFVPQGSGSFVFTEMSSGPTQVATHTMNSSHL